MQVKKLSWAGVRLEAGGVTLFIDPWENVRFFGDRFPGAPEPAVSETARRYVLLTHLHTDHFDRTVVRRLLEEDGARGAAVVLGSQAAEVAAEGLRVRSVSLWEPTPLGPYSVVALPAVDGWGTDQVAWAVQADGFRLFHGGDGLWHGRWWDFARTYGPFDLVFMPINGATTPGTDPPVRVARTMPPEEAAEAALALGAARVVPIHHGVSVPGSYEEAESAAERFRRAAEERRLTVEWPLDGDRIEI